MKPIIVHMKDMTDSVEVYESRPNPFLIYVIYTLAALVVIAFCWMYFSKLDILVKGNGMFRSSEEAVDVSAEMSGVVVRCGIEEGQYVEKGDVLFTLDAKSLEENIKDYEGLHKDTQDRIEMLQAYNSYLDGDVNAIEPYAANQYYDEFVNRKELLELTILNGDKEIGNQRQQYEKELENLAGQIASYEKQISKLRQVEDDVKNRVNSFDSSESYYHSIVSSYISNYNLTASQYDELLMDSEKEAALKNLELQQIATIEQQIATVNSSLSSANSSKLSIQTQLEMLNAKEGNNSSEINILTEQQNVATELLNCYAQKTEYENALNQYSLESGNANIVAESSGYIYMIQELNMGSYVTQGTTVCQILPKNEAGYYAEIYVENSDIAKLKVGQEVKFEIAAYPSSEYGYFTGVIESISKDVKINQATGSAYYLVKVKCDGTTVTDKDGKTGSIISGMACQAKIVVDEKNILEYLLEKLELAG